MFGSRARAVSDCVIETAEMSSLIALRFWMWLAGCGPPATQPHAPPSARAKANPKRSGVIGFLRLDRCHIRYRKCNNNQHQRYPQYIAQNAVLAGRAGSLRGLDDALVHDLPRWWCASGREREGPHFRSRAIVWAMARLSVNLTKI